MDVTDLGDVLDAIPDFPGYLTVDEMAASTRRLAEAYPDVARRWPIGRSRAGEAMEALVIGEGSRTAFLFGLPHPNEPVGAMTCEYLARRLCEDEALRRELDLTWVILKAADPDGARLNQGWFAGPLTLERYARHFYRPPSHEQVEWTFPVTHKRLAFADALPETRALMRVIDERRPQLMASLHNAGFGGAYWYLSRPDPALYPALHAAAARERLPLSLGEPEVPWASALAEGVYTMLGADEAYDYLEANGQDPLAVLPAGTSSADYATRQGYDTWTAVSEVPYFVDPRIADTSPAGEGHRAVVVAGADGEERLVDEIEAVLRAAGDIPDSPFARAIRGFAPQMRMGAAAERAWATASIPADEPATVAQAFDTRVVRPFYLLLQVGGLVRAIPPDNPARAAAEALFDRKLREVAAGMPSWEAVPVRRLVAVQVATVLAMARRLQAR